MYLISLETANEFSSFEIPSFHASHGQLVLHFRILLKKLMMTDQIR